LGNLDEAFDNEMRKCLSNSFPSYFRSLRQFRSKGRELENTRFDATAQMFAGVGIMVSTGDEYPDDLWNVTVKSLDEIVKEARKKGEERATEELIQMCQPIMDLIGLFPDCFFQEFFSYFLALGCCSPNLQTNF